MPRKNEPIRNSLEPKKTLRYLRDVYVSPKYKGGNKNGNSGRKERMVAWFHSKNPESQLGYKKRGACQRRGSGSRIFDSGKRLDQTKVFSTNCCACSGAFPSQF